MLASSLITIPNNQQDEHHYPSLPHPLQSCFFGRHNYGDSDNGGGGEEVAAGEMAVVMAVGRDDRNGRDAHDGYGCRLSNGG